jgi:hypothetical protein
VPDHVRERNASFAGHIRGKLVLAPLTKGGNLPFRQLCAHFGADVTMSGALPRLPASHWHISRAFQRSLRHTSQALNMFLNACTRRDVLFQAVAQVSER